MSIAATDSLSRRQLFIGILCILLSGAVAGAILPLSAILAGKQDGDGILTALISTQKLTWYFWGQDRLLNLLPALTQLVGDVEWNLRLQVALRAMLAYLAPIGILIFFTRQPRVLIVAIAVANIVLMSCLGPYALFNLYVQHNTAGTSLVLLAAAYALTYSRLPRSIIAVLTLAICSLAYATNFVLLTYALPTIFLLGALRRTQRIRYALFLLANLIAVVLAALHSRYFGEPSTSYGLAISLDALLITAKALHDNLHLLLFATFFGLALYGYRAAGEKCLWELGVPVSVALGLIVLLANTAWVQLNIYNIRYFITSLIILSAVIAYPITRAALAAVSSYRTILLCALVALANCVTLALGGFNGEYKELMGPAWRAQSAAVAKVAVAQNTRVIAGGFWDVWSAVYQTKKEQHGLPEAQWAPVYGASYRADVLRKQFLGSVLGQGEQNALCFYATAEQCIQEMTDRFHLPPQHRVELKGSEVLLVLNKPLLSLTFEIN